MRSRTYKSVPVFSWIVIFMLLSLNLSRASELYFIDAMLIQLKNSPSAAKFKDPIKTWFPEKDLELCLDINRFGFVLRASPYKNGLISMKPIKIEKETDQ